MTEADRLPMQEMYDKIHSNENIAIFQKELGIRSDHESMDEEEKKQAEQLSNDQEEEIIIDK